MIHLMTGINPGSVLSNGCVINTSWIGKHLARFSVLPQRSLSWTEQNLEKNNGIVSAPAVIRTEHLANLTQLACSYLEHKP
jgi:hypothetical protein